MMSTKTELQEFARGCYINYEIARDAALDPKKRTPQEQAQLRAIVRYWQFVCDFYYAAARSCNEEKT